MTKCVALLATLAGLSACGGTKVPKGPVNLDELRHSRVPAYYLGDSFESLPLTYADKDGEHASLVVYGSCETSGEPFSDGGCAPPLQIQSHICSPDSVVVTIYSDGHGRSARAAKALRPLNWLTRALGRPYVSFDRGVRC